MKYELLSQIYNFKLKAIMRRVLQLLFKNKENEN